MEGYACYASFMSSVDTHFLQHAIRIGGRGLGRTAPNPSVGCVLVKDNYVIATARTGDGGRPHAERSALDDAGKNATGATAYVSLEPCAHHGQTPPCAEALITAGVSRVVIGAVDPDPRVSGKGIALLEAAGIAVDVIPQDAALRDLKGFFRRINHTLPYVAMKIATSADGFLAGGSERWITGEAARAHGHRIRSTMDAVVTGIGTVLADDPLLTVRLPGLAHARCARIVCDRRLRLPLNSKLVRTAEMQPVWVITTATGVEEAASHATELREAGVMLHVVEDELLSPRTILTTLAENGLTRVLIEGGAALSASFLTDKSVDCLYWYQAPHALGKTGIAPVPGLETALGGALPALTATLGVDRLETYELKSCLPD